MKTLFSKLIGITLLVFSFAACDEDEINGANRSSPTVQFSTTQDTLTADSEELPVTIALSKPATTDGEIRISFDHTFAAYFSTSPSHETGTISLPVRKNDTQVQFKIAPGNMRSEETKTIVFTLGQVSPGLLIGTQKEFTLKIPGDVSLRESYASFDLANRTVKENSNDWQEFRVHVTEETVANGSIILKAESSNAVYGAHYISEPEFVDGKMTIPVTPGSKVFSFKVLTIDNDTISNHLEVSFTIAQTSGNIKKGDTLSDTLRITDDELEGMPKGYELSGGGWSMKKTFEYNSSGNVKRVVWESRTPFLKTGIDTYYYDQEDRVVKINTNQFTDILYHWEDGKIVRKDEVQNYVVTAYTEYGYDDAGNAASYRTFYRQPDGSFPLSDITLLLYYTDGNLYKKTVYYPTSPEEEVVISEATFDSYRAEENPFPMETVLPHIKSQKHLPNTYRFKSNGQDLLYHFAYEFRADGKVTKRVATTSNQSEVAIYHYY